MKVKRREKIPGLETRRAMQSKAIEVVVELEKELQHITIIYLAD